MLAGTIEIGVASMQRRAALRYLETGSCDAPAPSGAPQHSVVVKSGPGRDLITLLPEQ